MDRLAGIVQRSPTELSKRAHLSRIGNGTAKVSYRVAPLTKVKFSSKAVTA